MHFSLRFLPLLLFLALIVPANGVHEKNNGEFPWGLTYKSPYEQELIDALGGGWFMNVGPTGIRARITHEHPKYFTVKYVFKNSPAHGHVNIGDIVVGANGKKMNVAHTFGRRGAIGWDGPMVEMAKLIEDSQGKDGKLELIIWPGGSSEDEKTVTIEIEPVGRFSDTWPFDCERSDELYTKLCDFIVDEYENGNLGRIHIKSYCTLALMGHPDSKYQRTVRRIMDEYGTEGYDPTNANGFQAWRHVHEGIVMGEWYLMNRDSKFKRPMEELADCLNYSVWPTTGGLSHRPFAAIQRRMAAGGPKGYGAMAMPAGQGMLALSLFKHAGLPHADASYERMHEAYLSSVSGDGGIGYGFNSWDHAVIRLKDPNGAPKNSPRGIGFECLEGMKGIGEYEIFWPTKADPRYRPTDWLEKEAETNRVFDKGGNERLVIRNMSPDEPTKRMKNYGNSFAHHGRSGVGALAHYIGNTDNKSWNYLGHHLATGCANSGKRLMDGHASTHMHVLWGSLGAAAADERDYRKYLDDIKWWMIMAEAHDDKGYVIMPGRDYAAPDTGMGGRRFPAACAALILATKDRRLMITGKYKDVGADEDAPARQARKLDPTKKDLLFRFLWMKLAELDYSGALEGNTVELSKARTPVVLSDVGEDGTFTFKAKNSEHSASFHYNDLTTMDHANLAKMVADLLPDDGESQAVAAVYCELIKDTKAADDYFRKAGAALTEKMEGVFQQ